MLSLALKKLFKGKKDMRRDNDNIQKEKSKTQHTSSAKARFASLADTFRRRARLPVSVACEGQYDVGFESRIPDIVPLPQIAEVSGTLRRDLALFNPLPLIHVEESEDGSGLYSLVDTARMPRSVRPSPRVVHSIRRNPFPADYPVDDRTLSIAPPLMNNTIRRKPVPMAESIGESFCTGTPKEENRASIAQGSSAVNQDTTKKLIEPSRNSSNTLITSCDATASQPHLPTLSPSSSLPISLSRFSILPAIPRLRQTSFLGPCHVQIAVQIVHEAVHKAPTAVEAQQALLNLADVSASNTNSTVPNHDLLDEHSQRSYWEAALTINVPPGHDEWGPVENECRASTQMVGGFRLSRVIRDSRKQNDMMIAPRSEKDRALGEKEGLTKELAEANAVIKTERAEKKHFQRRFEEGHETYPRIYTKNTQLTEEKDVTCGMEDEKVVAAKTSDNHNTELYSTNTTRKCQVCQAKLVLDNHKDFQLRTGHTADEWYQQTTSPTQTHLELSDEHIHCEANFLEVVSQLSQTADGLTEAAKALKQSQTESWTYKHLHEEAERALEASQKMHKDANELVEMLQKDISSKETILQVERRCGERLLADAMRENAAKDERINRLCDTLSTHPKGDKDTHNCSIRQ